MENYLLTYNLSDLLSTPLGASLYIHSINYINPSNDMLISCIAGEMNVERNFSFSDSPSWFQTAVNKLEENENANILYLPSHQELYYKRGANDVNKEVITVVRKTANVNTNYQNKGLLFFNIDLEVLKKLTRGLNAYDGMQNVIMTDTGEVIYSTDTGLTQVPGAADTLLNCKTIGYLTLSQNTYMALTIQDELIHVVHYLEIQKIRHLEKLDYQIQSDEKYADFPLLKLTLQPLIENAIMHGFCPSHEKLFILLTVTEEDPWLIIQISDDGAGIPAEKLQQIQTELLTPATGFYSDSSPSIGIKNVYARLRLYYNKNVLLEIDSEQDEGTVITLKLPLDKDKTKELPE